MSTAVTNIIYLHFQDIKITEILANVKQVERVLRITHWLTCGFVLPSLFWNTLPYSVKFVIYVLVETRGGSCQHGLICGYNFVSS